MPFTEKMIQSKPVICLQNEKLKKVGGL